MKFPEQWDLDCFFPGGSHSSGLSKEIERVREAISALELLKDSKEILPSIQKIQEIDMALRQLDAFVICLESQNTADQCANQWRAELSVVDAKFQLFNHAFDTQLVAFDPKVFQDPELSEIRYVLEERRIRASRKLSPDKEGIITELSIDGYHGWDDIYPTIVNGVKITLESETLSFGQAENKLSHKERKVRQSVFSALENCWKEKGAIFSQVLNHLAGFRLQVYRLRGWNDPLQEPLFENRMQKQTLQAMWDAVDEDIGPLLSFLQAKAKLLGLDKLAWYDIEAPLFETQEKGIPYSQGASLIIEEFSRFHPKMGKFAQKACSEKWIDAEDRPGKRAGGFCIAFPKSKQSRIFMTYSGTMVNLSTLAHELGHGYHNTRVEDLPSLAQNYRMNVAETASTFAEQIISDVLLRHSKNREDKLNILADRIQRSVIFMMNIRARFLFETELYERRKTKFLSSDELCDLMQQSQETAYHHALSEWHPYFWAAKLHFYFTRVPFYNFPYTFGYLFSLGLYAQAKENGAGFAEKYDALLRESGLMSVEELAKKHLGVDLTKREFWQKAARAATRDVSEFLSLL
jgi:pepF/M3 family oligoendopeptidase